MKLKLETINGYNIAIDENAKIKEGDYIFSQKSQNIFKAGSIEYLEKHNMIEDFDKSFYINSKQAFKIIFADPELNLDLPVIPDWEQFEIEELEKLACNIYNLNWEEYKHIVEHVSQTRNCIEAEYEHLGLEIPNKYFDVISFIAGYNHNKAKYTEEDLRNCIEETVSWWEGTNDDFDSNDPYMSNSEDFGDKFIQSLKKLPKYIVVKWEQESDCDGGCITCNNKCKDWEQPILITLPNGDITGIIKELIW